MAHILTTEFNGTHTAQRHDLFSTGVQLWKEKPDAWFKAVNTALTLLLQTGNIPKDYQKQVGLFSTQARLAKIVTSAPRDFTKNVNAARDKTRDICNKGGDKLKFFDLFRSLNSIIPSVSDTCELIEKAIHSIPKHILYPIYGVSGASLVVGMGINAYESTCQLAGRKDLVLSGEKKKLDMPETVMSLIKETSYVALGCFIVLSRIFAVVANALVFSSLSALTVIFSIVPFYYKTLGEPIKDKV